MVSFNFVQGLVLAILCFAGISVLAGEKLKGAYRADSSAMAASLRALANLRIVGSYFSVAFMVLATLKSPALAGGCFILSALVSVAGQVEGRRSFKLGPLWYQGFLPFMLLGLAAAHSELFQNLQGYQSLGLSNSAASLAFLSAFLFAYSEHQRRDHRFRVRSD